MDSPVVVCEGVKKEYRRDSVSIPVLGGVDLRVESGEFVALMGPSGSGKTTLLNLLGGLDRPTSGRVKVAGEDLAKLSEAGLARWRARHVGFVFQLYHLIPVLTALENVELPLVLTPLSRRERRRHAESALRLVGLQDRLNHFPRQLSGGQEQRVAIARALVTDPTLLLADEPTGDLDARTGEEIVGILAKVNRELRKTIVMATHDAAAAAHAPRSLRLQEGRLAPE